MSKKWYEIAMYDLSDKEVNEMVDYCHDFKLNLESFSNTDISDVSPKWDMVAFFRFSNEQDAVAFKLKFQCK